MSTSAGEWRSFIKGLVNQSVSVSLEREALLQQAEASQAERGRERQAAQQLVQELQDNAAYQAEQLMELQNQVLFLLTTLYIPLYCFRCCIVMQRLEVAAAGAGAARQP